MKTEIINEHLKRNNLEISYSKVIIQGSDFKAKAWMQPLESKAVHFNNIRSLLLAVISYNRKCCIFRYLNSESNFFKDLIYTFVICLVCLFRKLLRLDIYWILHNVDKETKDLYPQLTKIKRKVISLSAKKIFVTDSLFLKECSMYFPKVFPISFGPKYNGVIKNETIIDVQRFSEKFDFVILCLGAVGPKYLHYDKLEFLEKIVARHNKKVGFVVSKDIFSPSENMLLIDEPNLDESVIKSYIDGIYRINDDISMPYTVYAACSAGIPLISNVEYWTFKILQEYGIGFSEEAFFTANEKQINDVKKNMDVFLSNKNWQSLAKNLS